MQVNDKLEKMLKKIDNQVKPGKWFALKMRYRIYAKSSALYVRRLFVKPARIIVQRKYRFAGAVLLVTLTLTSGVGAYAYASPDVTVLSPLYPVKQGIENAQMYFAQSPTQKASLQREKAMRRMAEAEFLARYLKQSPDSSPENDGMQLTLQELESNMQLSLSSASEIDEPDTAQDVIKELHDDFSELDEHVNALQNREQLRNATEIQVHLNKLHDFAQQKIDRMNRISKDVDTALKAGRPRIYLIHLIRENGNDETESITSASVTDPEALPLQHE